MKGIVYCIKELSTGDVIYVGSTTQLLRCRKSAHKYNCYCSNPKLNSVPVYEYIRSKASKSEFYSKFIFETLICGDFNDDDLHVQENCYIKQLKPLYNCRQAFSSEEEKKANAKKWRNKDENRAKLNAYSKMYNTVNSDKRKKYREDNKDKIKEKNRKYYELHKEELKAKSKARHAAKNNVN